MNNRRLLFFVFFVLLAALAMPRLSLAQAKVLATINGESITDDIVDKKAGPRMMRVLTQEYEVKREVLDEIIEQKLLEKEAQKRGATVDSLLNMEVKDKTKAPSDVELRTIFEMQKDTRFKGKTFEDVKDNLNQQLKYQKERMAYDALMSSLKKTAQIQINLERPSVNVSVDDDPAQGNPNAPIKLIEFSEFQCPFCKRARPVLDKVLSTYQGKIYYVFRDFPLSFHKDAKNAAMAANCAHDQGKYWDFSKELWAQQQQLGDTTYTNAAKKIGLNLSQFNQCYTSRKYEKEINKDQNDGMEVGVSGTPAYFINGKFLSGAQPFESFKEIIDEELAKQK